MYYLIHKQECFIRYEIREIQDLNFRKIVRQLAQANENLTENVVKTILTANKIKELIYTHEV